MPVGGTPNIGIDIGGTKILGVVRGPASGETVQAQVNALTPLESHELLAALVDVVDQLLAATPLGSRISSIGVGVPGFVGRDGIATQSPNAPAVVGLDLSGFLAERFGVPVVVDNDANCAAVATARIDAPDMDHVVVVTLGTGIGGGIVVDGRILRGHHGYAGEFGHMIVDVGGAECPCGQFGCWEVLASGSGLGRLARRAAVEGRAESVLAAAGGDVDAIDGPLVSRCLAVGDAGAAAIFDELASWVAVGLVNIINILDPAVIVLGGGLVREGDALLGRVRRELAGYPTVAVGRQTQIRASGMGNAAGAIGAAMLAETPSEVRRDRH